MGDMEGEFTSNYFSKEQFCRIPSFGLATKQRGCKVAGQEEARESRQKGRKGASQEEAWESHHILMGV